MTFWCNKASLESGDQEAGSKRPPVEGRIAQRHHTLLGKNVGTQECVWSDLSFFIYYFFKLQIRSQSLVCMFYLRIAMWEIRVIALAVLVSFLKSHTLSFPLNNMSRNQRAADSVVSLNVTFERASAAPSIACFSIHSPGSTQADPTWLPGSKRCGLITLWQAAFMLLCPHKFINDSFCIILPSYTHRKTTAAPTFLIVLSVVVSEGLKEHVQI